MTLKTYQAQTMADCLAEVKRDLGRDAVILQTRSVRQRGMWGWLRRSVWEVTASPNLNVPKRIVQGEYVGESPTPRRAGDDGAAAPPPLPPAPSGPEPSAEPAAPKSPAGLAGRVDDIHQMLKDLVSRAPRERAYAPPLVPELEQFRQHLLEQDIPDGAATELLRQLCMELTGQQLGDRELIRHELRRRIAERIGTVADEGLTPGGRSGRPRVIALVGPTGVGKTTTIAKLAANYRLHQGKRVGLVTMDTYRIAAVEQLRTYANIIEVPIRPVLSTGELEAVLKTMLDRDVVLMDTAGRSQNNRLRLSQLRSFVAAAQPDEVHLVVSATTNRLGTLQVLERFLPLGANRLIVTKLDEAAAFGVFLNAALAAGLPLSYVTTGQDVPEDILPADADALAECIVTGRFGEAVDVG